MRFTVVWSPSASQDLADIWIRADNRHEVAQAADLLDATLARDPNNQGESRQEGIRVIFAGCLGINFEVHDDDRKVRVLAVWRTDRR